MMLAWISCFCCMFVGLKFFISFTFFVHASVSEILMLIPGPFYYDDLEDMMFDSISESFNADFEDGSVGEVIIFSFCHFRL